MVQQWTKIAERLHEVINLKDSSVSLSCYDLYCPTWMGPWGSILYASTTRQFLLLFSISKPYPFLDFLDWLSSASTIKIFYKIYMHQFKCNLPTETLPIPDFKIISSFLYFSKAFYIFPILITLILLKKQQQETLIVLNFKKFIYYLPSCLPIKLHESRLWLSCLLLCYHHYSVISARRRPGT